MFKPFKSFNRCARFKTLSAPSPYRTLNPKSSEQIVGRSNHCAAVICPQPVERRPMGLRARRCDRGLGDTSEEICSNR